APGPQFNPVFLSPSEPGEKPFNPETMEGWAVWGFKAGRPAQIGGRDAKVISYQVGPKGNRDAMPVTLWLDAQTHVPLKSMVAIKSENLHITEMYTEFKIDPQIDSKRFALAPETDDAEKLLRTAEAKINAAKTVEVTFEHTAKVKAKEEKFKGSLLYTKDNKARLTMRVPEDGKDRIEMVSDGKQMKVAYPPEDTLAKSEALPVPAVLHDVLTKMASGPGLLLTYDLMNVPEWFDKDGNYAGRGRPAFRLTDFESRPMDKVGGRDAKVISYRVLLHPGGDCDITLWIDAETLLPVKRAFAGDGKEGPFAITEACRFNLSPKIEAGTFTLPK